MDIGTLDKRVLIEVRSTEQEPRLGEELDVWAEHATVWASANDVVQGKSEEVRQYQRILIRPCKVRMRYLGSVTADMRITILGTGRVMQIVTIAELGRREGLELMCDEFSS